MPPKAKKPKTTTKRKSQRGGMAQLNAFHKLRGTPHGTMINHPQYGTGLWDAIKGGFNWLKDNKVISTVASMIPHPAAQRVGSIAGQLGLGGRKRRNVLRF